MYFTSAVLKRSLKMAREIGVILVAFAFGFMAAPAHAEDDWFVKAQFIASCSCNAMCPCLLGSPPTHDFCQGTHLVEIKKGHYGGINLDGLAIVATSHRPQWIKLYIDESASDAQMDALLELLKLDETLGSIYAGKTPIVSQERVKISFDQTSDNVKFSVPASTVEIELMKGLGGKPIEVKNLPHSFTYGFTQYKSISNTHQSDEHKFSHSGTNGWVSWLAASSNAAKE